MSGGATSPQQPVAWLTDDEQRAWRAVVGGVRRLRQRLDQDLKAHGLNGDDYAVLVRLSEAEEGRARMSELAEQAVESRSRLSHHVGRLEQRGLVERRPCDDDRRGSWAVLTPAGRAAIEGAAPDHVAGVRTWFLDHLDAGELDVIAGAFARIDDALQGGPDT